MDICKYTVLSLCEILSILDSSKLCKLGTTNCTELEIVPMWYVYSYVNNSVIFYLISANSGTKMDHMKDTGIACIFIEQDYVDHFTDVYNSVVANGTATIIDNYCEKATIIDKFNLKYGANKLNFCINQFDFIKVSISEITGRSY